MKAPLAISTVNVAILAQNTLETAKVPMSDAASETPLTTMIAIEPITMACVVRRSSAAA